MSLLDHLRKHGGGLFSGGDEVEPKPNWKIGNGLKWFVMSPGEVQINQFLILRSVKNYLALGAQSNCGVGGKFEFSQARVHNGCQQCQNDSEMRKMFEGSKNLLRNSEVM